MSRVRPGRPDRAPDMSGGVPVQEEALTVAEAAVRLGVNDKTVRRWVKAGRLSATLTDGPYGKQYRIPADALGAAQQALAVVTVDRGTDPRALALAVVKALEPRDAVLRADVDVMRQEIAALRALLEERLPLPVRGVQTPGQDDQGLRNGAVLRVAHSPVGSNLLISA
jgi:MerR family copper efflux transcriptional regulator